MRLPFRARPSPTALIAVGLFILSLAVYLSGLPPSITWAHEASDGPELATVVKTWGVAHPSGYPTYTLLGKLFSIIPAGDVAHRLSIMSAVAGAAAVAFTFLAATRVLAMMARRAAPAQPREGREPWFRLMAAASGALALAFSPIMWGQSVVAEVYALNILFGAAIAYVLLAWIDDAQHDERPPSLRKPLLAALLFGLAMGNHYTVAAIGVP
ncbi:MAG: DUF2723 domain-containing protein, partial [Chloroflexi bacterium]|nr:DUF2723 domain-containing protein [Chloroflexota bacterium]